MKKKKKNVPKQRVVWERHPGEQVVPNKKRYNRKKEKKAGAYDYSE